jgi:hypothetical protein
MKLRDLKRPLLAGATFFGTVLVLSVGYSAFTAGYPATVSTGATLSSSEWNKMAGALQTLNGSFSFSGGNVGIGGTPGAILDVVGPTITGSPWTAEAIRWRSSSYPNSYGSIWTDMSGAGGGIAIGMMGLRSLYVAQSGNVGIGTSTPGVKFEVAGPMKTSDSNGYLQIDDYGGTNGFGFELLQVNGSAYSGKDMVFNNWSNAGYQGGWVFADSAYNAGVFKITAGGNATMAGTLTQSSDRRLKTGIEPITGSLEKIQKLNGVTYYWKDADRGRDRQIGLIAQDVESAFPEAVRTDIDGFESVAYGNLMGPLVEAVKELAGIQKSDTSRLEERMDVLERENVELKKRIEILDGNIQ